MGLAWKTAFVTLVMLSGMLLAAGALAVECEDAEMCEDPCPAENSCESDADCEDGFECVPHDTPGLPCNPSDCSCQNNGWSCTDDCADQCVQVQGVPTTSVVGNIALVLLLLAVTPVFLRRRPRVGGAE